MTNFPIRLICADIRSALNVGAILRSADACAVELVYACGYTPHPTQSHDARPAHVADSNTRAIAKTALGAERTVPILYYRDITQATNHARSEGFSVIAVEQDPSSIALYDYRPGTPVAIVVGNETQGLDTFTLQSMDHIIEIPMLGQKESLNVAVAASIAMYHLRFGA